jgi:hypothetical protein
MRWDDALAAVLQRLRSDTELMDALGGDHIVRADGTAPPVPGITYEVTSSRRRENDEVVFTRWDVRAPTLAGVVAVERRLHEDLDRTVPETVSGVPMWLEYVDAWDVPGEPAGTVHRTVLFRFTLMKET